MKCLVNFVKNTFEDIWDDPDYRMFVIVTVLGFGVSIYTSRQFDKSIEKLINESVKKNRD